MSASHGTRITPPTGPVYIRVAEGVDEEVRTAQRNSNRRSSATLSQMLLRVAGSLLVKGLLLWAIRSGFKFARDSRNDGLAVGVGLMTMLLAFLLLMLGLPILASWCFSLSERLQGEACR